MNPHFNNLILKVKNRENPNPELIKFPVAEFLNLENVVEKFRTFQAFKFFRNLQKLNWTDLRLVIPIGY